MAVLNIPRFVGVSPRGSATPGRYNYATKAHNLTVDDNAIQPMQADRLVNTEGMQKRLWCGCDEILVDPCAVTSEYVDGGCTRHVVSKQGEEPYFQACGSDCPAIPVRIPPPDTRNTLALGSGSMSPGRDLVYYAITYETCLCDETRPSYVIGGETTDGSVAIFSLPTAPSYVKKTHIYRSQSGFRQGTEEVQEQVTEWYRVGSVDPGTTDFFGAVPMSAAGVHLQTRTHHPLEEGVCNVQSLSNKKVLVGSKGKRLFYSMHGEPSNWDFANELTFDEDIVQVIPNAGYTTVITRNGKYYTVLEGECGNNTCRQVIERDSDPKYQPVSCCGNSAATPFGNLVPTIDGLALYKGDGSVEIISTRWFTTREWRRSGSESALVGYYEGRVFLNMGGVTYTANILNPEGKLTTVDMEPRWFQYSPTGELMYGNDTGLYHVFGSSTNREWEYEQDVLVERPAVYRNITADACDTFSIRITSKCSCITSDCVADYSIECLPEPVVSARRLTVSMSGTECVRSVTLGSSAYALGDN